MDVEEKAAPEVVQTAEPEKETIAVRAAKLRAEKKAERDGRRNTETAEDSIRHPEPGNQTARRDFKILRGEGGGTEPGDRRNNGTERGTDKEPLRVRQSDRRSGNDHERPDGNVQGATTQRRVAGRLELDGPVPDRLPDPIEPVEPKRGRGRPRKEETPGQEKKGFLGFGGGDSHKEKGVLSHAEAERLREPFIAALKDDCKYADEFLWWYSKDESQPQIWSDMDDEDIETLATVLLNRAQRSPATATFVRNVVDGADYISTAMIVVPRVIKSAQQVNKRPKSTKKAKSA